MFRAAAFFLLVWMGGSLLSTSYSPQRGEVMEVGELMVSPRGHHDFCRRQPYACRIYSTLEKNRVIELTEDSWRLLKRVNTEINNRYISASDGHEDYWTYPIETADCEDYALAKQRELMQVGLPQSALLLAVVRMGFAEYHAVLIVRTDHGDLVLDNLRTSVHLWNRTGYVWIMRQTGEQPTRWRRVTYSG